MSLLDARGFTMSSWSIGRRLWTGFGLVVAVFLIALGIALVYSSRADSTWSGTLRWSDAERGIAQQIRSTQAQMFEQNALVATWDPVHISRWEQAVTLGDRGAAAVATVHDPVISRISAGAKT